MTKKKSKKGISLCELTWHEKNTIHSIEFNMFEKNPVIHFLLKK